MKYIGEPPKRDDYVQRWNAAYFHDIGCYQQQQAMAGQPRSLGNVSPSEVDPNLPPGCVFQANPPDHVSYLRQASDEYDKALGLYAGRYDAFWLSASQGLVENRFFVHVPFFGLSFDVNDLGMLAGVGLTSTLLLLWFATETELENLKLSFAETKKLKCFGEFYRLAAMRQVLTIPPLPDREAGALEIWLPKPISFLPLAVYLWLFIHDLGTYRIGTQLNTLRMNIFVGSELLFLCAIAALAVQCFRLERRIDTTWTDGWCSYIAEHFRVTGQGKWLKHASEAAKRLRVLPSQLVKSLPESSFGNCLIEMKDDIHTYKSGDKLHQLVIDLQTNSVVYTYSGL